MMVFDYSLRDSIAEIDSAGSVWGCARCTATRSPRRSFVIFMKDFGGYAPGTEALSGLPKRCSTSSSP